MIKNLSLYNYRNLHADYLLASRANLVVSPNGTGKSNLLESVFVLAIGSSFHPTTSVADLVGSSEDFTSVTAILEDNTKLQLVNPTNGKRTWQINGKSRRQSAMRSYFKPILFAPHALDLINGDPANRRSDLDNFLSLQIEEYSSLISKYTKVIRNRNSLLRHIRDNYTDPGQMDFWDSALIELGSQIVMHRRNYIISNAERILSFGNMAYGRPRNLEINYRVGSDGNSEGSYQDWLTKKITSNRSKEISSGQSLYGPHRDDIEILLDSKPLRFLGSRGEQRLAVLSWKLSQAQALWEMDPDNKPMLLVDDAMSELDEQHRDTVGHLLLEQPTQFILTAADHGYIPKFLQNSSQNIILNPQEEK